MLRYMAQENQLFCIENKKNFIILEFRFQWDTRAGSSPVSRSFTEKSGKKSAENLKQMISSAFFSNL